MIYYQLNMFDAPDNMLTPYEKCLVRGSNFEGGKIRIYAAAFTVPNKDFSKFLKEEYGIGGCSTDDGFMFYESKGISISKRPSYEKQTYKWTQVAKDIKRLINLDLYLTDKEKERIKDIQKKNNGLPTPEPKYQYG